MGRSYRVDGVTKPARAANHVHDGHNRPRTGPGMQASATMTADDRQAFGDLLQQHRGIVFKVANARSEEHTSELQSLMRISYAVFCLKKKNTTTQTQPPHTSKQ